MIPLVALALALIAVLLMIIAAVLTKNWPNVIIIGVGTLLGVVVLWRPVKQYFEITSHYRNSKEKS